MENIEEIMDFIDCTGKQRRFKFETLESGPLMRLEAREIRNDKQPGYYFREIGMVDHYALLRGSLNLKIKEGLSKRYIVPRKEGVGRWEMLTEELTGYMDFDEESEEICFVVDSYKVTWDEFKDLIRAYEGFLFHLKFED